MLFREKCIRNFIEAFLPIYDIRFSGIFLFFLLDRDTNDWIIRLKITAQIKYCLNVIFWNFENRPTLTVTPSQRLSATILTRPWSHKMFLRIYRTGFYWNPKINYFDFLTCFWFYWRFFVFHLNLGFLGFRHN